MLSIDSPCCMNKRGFRVARYFLTASVLSFTPPKNPSCLRIFLFVFFISLAYSYTDPVLQVCAILSLLYFNQLFVVICRDCKKTVFVSTILLNPPGFLK